MSTVLITGANRGLGLAHARGFIARGDTVIACCRSPETAEALHALAKTAGDRLRIEKLDVAAPEDADRLARDLAGVPIDILINNAGIYGGGGVSDGDADQSLKGMDYDLWARVLAINVMAPFRLTAALLPSIEASERRTVVMMSSDVGSIGNSAQGGMYAYRTSKSALNMLTKSLSNELAPRGITVISMAPGWVQTDMGGPSGHWSVEDSVEKQQAVIASLTPADTGRFINLLGETVAW